MLILCKHMTIAINTSAMTLIFIRAKWLSSHICASCFTRGLQTLKPAKAALVAAFWQQLFPGKNFWSEPHAGPDLCQHVPLASTGTSAPRQLLLWPGDPTASCQRLSETQVITTVVALHQVNGSPWSFCSDESLSYNVINNFKLLYFSQIDSSRAFGPWRDCWDLLKRGGGEWNGRSARPPGLRNHTWVQPALYFIPF